ncbi:MAG: hypothetical protein ACREDM_02755 [Methylocella sp.]
MGRATGTAGPAAAAAGASFGAADGAVLGVLGVSLWGEAAGAAGAGCPGGAPLPVIFSHHDSEAPAPAEPPKTARAIAKVAEPCHGQALAFVDDRPLLFAAQNLDRIADCPFSFC